MAEKITELTMQSTGEYTAFHYNTDSVTAGLRYRAVPHMALKRLHNEFSVYFVKFGVGLESVTLY